MKQLFLFLVFALLSFFFASNIFAQAGEWTWISGSSSMNGVAAYGTQGIPSVNNHPSALYEACEWTDTSGMFWLYGGSSPSFDMANLWKFNPLTNEWTWVKGPGDVYASAVYGTIGVPNANNTPGSRAYGITTWTGKDGDLWLFGGYTFGPDNDLWKYNIATNEWTWVKGPNVSGDMGTYGTQGIPDANNVPGCRGECSASWTDNDGNLWFFGGGYYQYSYNDLWRYNPVTNEWTWMKGSNTTGAVGVYGTLGVPDAANTPGSRNAYAKGNDGNNHLYLFGGDNFNNGEQHNDVWQYDIATNNWTWVSGTSQANNTGNAASQCDHGTSYDPSGRRENRASWTDPCHRFWFYGGSSQGSFYGSQNDLWKFDPVTLEWTWVNGSLNILQTGSFGTQGVSSPTNQPPSRSGNNAWTDKNGNLWLFGGCDLNWPSAWNDLWRFVPDTSCTGSCIVNNQQSANFAASDTDICEKFCINFFDASQNNPTSWLWSFPGGSPATSTSQNPTNICYDVPGVYDVTLIATGANGSDTTTFTGFITVYATPPFPTISQNGYVLTSSAASSYQWQLNSYDIPGATNQSYTVMQTGLYTVIVGDANGCKNSASTYVLISAVNEVGDDPNIFISPNPSAGNFSIQFLNSEITGEVSIDVVNALGQVVFSSSEKISATDWRKQIDLGKSAHGIYFLEIKSEKEFLKKKIILSN